MLSLSPIDRTHASQYLERLCQGSLRAPVSWCQLEINSVMSWRARLSVSLNELRVVYCAKSASSEGTREFIKNNYKTFKILNPGLPIYMRPSDGAEPHVAARYERGVYEIRPTSGMSESQVLSIVKELEASAPQINSNIGGGIGGNKFKLADII